MEVESVWATFYAPQSSIRACLESTKTSDRESENKGKEGYFVEYARREPAWTLGRQTRYLLFRL